MAFLHSKVYNKEKVHNAFFGRTVNTFREWSIRVVEAFLIVSKFVQSWSPVASCNEVHDWVERTN